MKLKLLIVLIVVLGLVSCNSGRKKQPTKEIEKFVIERGLNISHWLSQTESRGAQREQYMTAIDFEKIADMGFDHVRIPFDEEQMWDELGNRQEDAFKLLHKAINWSFENNLCVIVDLHILRSHYFNDTDIQLWRDTLAQQQFCSIWEQLSGELQQYPNSKLAYELLNEAVAEDPEDWNSLVAKGIATIRKKEPNRTIIVGSNRWQQVHTFKDLKIPADDSNIILSFHYYEPFFFTHYKAPWVTTFNEYTGEVHYPGYTIDTIEYSKLSLDLVARIKEQNDFYDKDVFEEQILKAIQVAKKYDLPLYCGEFGCYPTTDLETRVKIYTDLMEVFEKHNIAWAHWNYKNDFPVVDAESLDPIDEIVSVLIATN
jgi:endoglucanase